MATQKDRERKNANSTFRQMMDKDVRHVRIGSQRGDNTGIRFIGHAKDLHGPQGVCTCCPRRPKVAAS